MFNHPQKRLIARRPIWADTTSVDQRAQWEEDWLSAAVVNSHLVCDPTIQQPGFDLPRHFWTLLNRFHTGQGQCRAKMHKWGLASSPLCDCEEQQTMEHTVDSCPMSTHKTGWRLVEPPRSRRGCHQLAEDDGDKGTREMK